MKINFKNNKGFTLLEGLLVIAITIILASAVLPIYGNLQTSAQLNETSSQVVQFVRMARERSVDGFNNSRHGVKFEADRYTLYQGVSYSLRNTNYDRETVLDNSLSIATGLTDNEINFSKGLGVPDNTGTITITHSVYGSKTITINEYGMVGEN